MSWERSRYIPWSRISDVSGTDGYESQKERVHRSLVREANREKEFMEKSKGQPSVGSDMNDDTMNTTPTFVPPEVLAQQNQKNKGLFNSGIDYTTPDLVRTFAFGGCIGSITGTVFGFMDSMKTAQENPIIKNASNIAKSKYLMEGTTRSGMVFGAFFSGFHCLKYGIRIASDPGHVYEAIGASAISLSALAYKPAMRPNIPYAAMLIGMDCFSLYMNSSE